MKYTLVALASILFFEVVLYAMVLSAEIIPVPPADTQTVWHVVDGIRIIRTYTTHDTCYTTVSELGGMASGFTHSTSCLRGQ